MRLTKRIRWRLGFARVVLAQLRTSRPPEVRQTFVRLRSSGLSAWRVYRLLIAVYEAEVAAMLTLGRAYDHEAYLARLAALPAMPAESLGS